MRSRHQTSLSTGIMVRLRNKLKQLTVVRLIFMVSRGLLIVGRWEFNFFRRLFSGLFLIGSWPLRLIINIGYGVSRLLSKLGRPLGSVNQTTKKSGERLAAWRKHLASDVVNLRQRLQPRPRRTFLKPALSFAVLLLVLIFPLKLYGHWQSFKDLKTKIITAATAAISELSAGKEAVEKNDLTAADTSFSRAAANFSLANQELNKINKLLFVLADLAPNQELRLAGASQRLVTAGQLGSQLAAELTVATDQLFNNSQGRYLTAALVDFGASCQRAKTLAGQLNEILAPLNPADFPADYQEQFRVLRQRAVWLETSLGELTDLNEKLRLFLGEAYDKRYLLIFQNNTEARASGGFMGSFALVDFSRGNLKKLQVPGGGTYDTEAGLQRFIQAPAPLQLLKARWYMWDANWWPDWPTSARKIMWFYEQSGGSTVDGVISLTPEVVMKLLAVVGPIDLTNAYGVVVTADNFLDVVQPIVEQKQVPTTTPKQIIGDLTSKLLDQLAQTKTKDSWLAIVNIIEQSLNEKQLLLYFSDEQLENKVKEFGWDAALRQTPEDYLQVVNTNIGGGKSDRKIKQTLELSAAILSDGSIINNLTIIRDHQAVKGEAFSGVRNVDWLRVYVPQGSKLLTSEGWRRPDEVFFDYPEAAWELDDSLANERAALTEESTGTLIYDEQGKTVFANWSMVDPGQAAVIKLTYKLPFKLTLRQPAGDWLDKILALWQTPDKFYRYSLLAQKQPGVINSEINFKLDLPSSYQTIWQYPPDSRADYLPQNTDRYWAWLLKDKE